MKWFRLALDCWNDFLVSEDIPEWAQSDDSYQSPVKMVSVLLLRQIAKFATSTLFYS